jgi:alkaline phosphatase D
MPSTTNLPRALSRRAVTQLAAVLPLMGPAGTLLAQTAPPRPVARIAFGSCADQTLPQPIWDAVLAYRPELFIFGGDNAYGGMRTSDLAELRAAYDRQRVNDGYMRLLRSVPHLAIWDDHDYGINDGGVDNPFKEQAKEEFLRFWSIAPTDPRRSRPGIYHAIAHGEPGQRLQVILLDTRWFRSPLKPTDQRGAPGRERYVPDEDPAKTMLGEAQWQWLRTVLSEPADVRLIMSSVQVVADGHGWERWGNLPRERQRLYDLIGETKAGGVVFMSGDRHIGALYRETKSVPYPMVDITSSGINKFFAAAKEEGPNRLGAIYALPNFGTIDLDWWERTVTLAVRGEGGEARRTVTLKLDELRA